MILLPKKYQGSGEDRARGTKLKTKQKCDSKCIVSRNIGYYFTKSIQREGNIPKETGPIKKSFYFIVWKKKLCILDRIRKISSNEKTLKDPRENIRIDLIKKTPSNLATVKSQITS